MSNSGNVQVKKVKAYPFDASLEAAGKKINVHVRRITQQGMIADVGAHLLVVGEEYKITLELPTLGKWVNSMAKVMKTYDQFVNETATHGHVERMAEFLFIGISADHRANIQNFMTTIKQA